MAQTALDAKLGPKAQAVIARFGKSVSYRQVADSTYDTTTAEGTVPETVLATKVIFAQGKNEAPDRGSARLVYAAAKPFTDISLTPRDGDFMVLDGIRYSVVGVPEVFYSGEQPVLYAIFIRA